MYNHYIVYLKQILQINYIWKMNNNKKEYPQDKKERKKKGIQMKEK